MPCRHAGNRYVDREDWAEAAQLILADYRAKFNYAAVRKEQDALPIKCVDGVLERSFQLACHSTVAILVPQVHPLAQCYDRMISSACGTSPGLPSPHAWQMVLTAFMAKILVGCTVYWMPQMPLLHTVPHQKLLHPLSLQGLEFSFFASAAGVTLSYLVGSIRRRFYQPPSTVALLLQVATCVPLGLWVCLALEKCLHEAQVRRSYMLPGAVRAIFRCLGRLGHRSEEHSEWSHHDCNAEEPPADLLCPITSQLFVRPVLLHGMVFEERAARRWVEATSRHPTLQDIACHVGEFKRALELERLCHRFAAARGWKLQRRFGKAGLSSTDGTSRISEGSQRILAM